MPGYDEVHENVVRVVPSDRSVSQPSLEQNADRHEV